MMKPILIALATITLLAGTGVAEAVRPGLNVGDRVAVEMTGELAHRYARSVYRSTSKSSSPGLSVQIIAEVGRVFDDGRVRIEHVREMVINGKTRRVVLTAMVDAAQIRAELLPANTPLYSSPTAAMVPSESETKSLRLRLTDSKGITIQQWELVDKFEG